VQVDGDYVESWQPQAMSAAALEKSRAMAAKVTAALGGFGIFGVELFVTGDEVWFSEVSPRPHDTGLVTLVSQYQSEFALHARAILGLPVSTALKSPGASAVIYGGMDAKGIAFEGVDLALAVPETELRLFGKPEAFKKRRMGVALARGRDTDEARDARKDGGVACENGRAGLIDLCRVFHAEHGAVVVIGEQLGEARPAHDGAQGLFGQIGRHVVFEFVEEARLGCGVAFALVENAPDMGRERHIADQQPREDALAVVDLGIDEALAVVGELDVAVPTSASRRSCRLSATGNRSSISSCRSDAISGRSALPLKGGAASASRGPTGD
jgi:hypothetical protein